MHEFGYDFSSSSACCLCIVSNLFLFCFSNIIFTLPSFVFAYYRTIHPSIYVTFFIFIYIPKYILHFLSCTCTCLLDVLRSQDNPNCFFFYELYENMKAVDYHKQQPHYNLWADFKASGGTVSSVSHKTDGEFLT